MQVDGKVSMTCIKCRYMGSSQHVGKKGIENSAQIIPQKQHDKESASSIG